MTENITAAPVVDDLVVSAPEPKDRVDKSELDELREQIESSKKEVERERLRAEAAERQREEYSQKFSNEATQRIKAQGESIDNRIAARHSEAERLKREIKEAHESGKLDEYADLVAEYSGVKQDIRNYENHKAQVIAQEESRLKVNNDPIANFTPRTQQWIKNNPEFLSDVKFQRKALAAHQMALAEDYTPDTDAYFEYIESYVRPQKNPANDPPELPAKPENQKKPLTSIPPSRPGSSGSTNGQNKQQVRLTADEVEIAMMSFPGMSPADAQNEYYKNKVELIKAGKMGGNY